MQILKVDFHAFNLLLRAPDVHRLLAVVRTVNLSVAEAHFSEPGEGGFDRFLVTRVQVFNVSVIIQNLNTVVEFSHQLALVQGCSSLHEAAQGLTDDEVGVDEALGQLLDKY